MIEFSLFLAFFCAFNIVEAKDAKELPERNEATNKRTGGGGGGIDRAFCPPNTTSTTLIT